MKDKMDTLLTSWVKFQQLRGLKKTEKLVWFNVFVNTQDDQYCAKLKVTSKYVIIDPIDLSKLGYCFDKARLEGCGEEGSKVILNLKFNRPSYEIQFPTRETKDRATLLIHKLLRDENSNSEQSETSSMDSPEESL